MTFWKDSVGIKATEKQSSVNVEIRRWACSDVTPAQQRVAAQSVTSSGMCLVVTGLKTQPVIFAFLCARSGDDDDDKEYLELCLTEV